MHERNLAISELWIYPVKSLGGIALQQSEVLPKGLKHDRRWMLVDDANHFLTQRFDSRLALFRLHAVDNGFSIQYQQEEMLLPFHHEPGSTRAIIWNDEVVVHEVSTLLSEWFSEHLGIRCKLVYFPENNPRPVDPEFAIANDQTNLSDGYPILVLGEASVADLNNKLATPVPKNRFRPNIVFKGGAAYEEDGWKNFSAGSCQFIGVKPCGRCVVTTIDQLTNEKGIEPLHTLNSYRKVGSKVLFGQNVLVQQSGVISVGDPIHLT